MITIGGMIGLGKSSVAKLLGEHFGIDVFYESVVDNPILPLFYTASDEEIKEKRYPFLLQLYFLESKINSLKEAKNMENSIVDRSIYEDWYFAKINHELGRISDLEFEIYERLFKNMLSQLEDSSFEIMIYLKGSFETVLTRINKRGRSYELDEHLKAYYEKLWHGYDALIAKYFDNEWVLTVDMDQIDIVNNEEDAKWLIHEVEVLMGKKHNKCI